MKYKTVCYVWIKDKVYTSVFSNDEFVLLRDEWKLVGIPRTSYYAAKYEEINKIIVREEPCQTGN